MCAHVHAHVCLSACAFLRRVDDLDSALCPEVKIDDDLSLYERVTDSGVYINHDRVDSSWPFHKNLF